MLDWNVSSLCGHIIYSNWISKLIFVLLTSNSKPDALFNVELVAKDDAERLQEVFKSFENFSIKEFFEEFDFIKRQVADEKKDMQTTLTRSVKPLLLSITQLCTSLMSGKLYRNFRYCCYWCYNDNNDIVIIMTVIAEFVLIIGIMSRWLFSVIGDVKWYVYIPYICKLFPVFLNISEVARNV